MAQLRQVVTLHTIIPFASPYVREALAKKKKLPFTYLFYGPSGGGKTLMVRAIATETRAIVFDLTLENLRKNLSEDVKAV